MQIVELRVSFVFASELPTFRARLHASPSSVCISLEFVKSKLDSIDLAQAVWAFARGATKKKRSFPQPGPCKHDSCALSARRKKYMEQMQGTAGKKGSTRCFEYVP